MLLASALAWNPGFLATSACKVWRCCTMFVDNLYQASCACIWAGLQWAWSMGVAMRANIKIPFVMPLGLSRQFEASSLLILSDSTAVQPPPWVAGCTLTWALWLAGSVCVPAAPASLLLVQVPRIRDLPIFMVIDNRRTKPIALPLAHVHGVITIINSHD